MRELTQRTIERTAAALLDLHTHQDFLTLPQHLVKVIRKLLPVDITTYNEVDLTTNELRAVHDLRGNPEKYFPAFMAHQHEYLPLQHFMRTGDSTPLICTDFSTRRQFEQTGLYNEFYKVFGIRQHMAVYFPPLANFHVAMILFRYNVAFTEEERSILKFLSPHLALAWRNPRVLAQANQSPSARTAANWRSRLCRVRLDGDWRIRECDEHSARWMSRHFKTPVFVGSKLPPLLIAQFSRIPQSPVESFAQLGKPLVFLRDDEQLEVQWVPESPLRSHLNLICRTRNASFNAERLALTPKESEVLEWLLEGKTNPEIGVILGISANTVRKHLERVYAKLGVENRMSAMRAALDF